MPLKFEAKSTASLSDVQHETLQSGSGRLLGALKAEYLPSFVLFGKPLEFCLNATEQSFLKPRSLSGLVTSAKIKLSPSLNVTGKYSLAKKAFSSSTKVQNTVAGKMLKTEIKYAPNSPVGIESELFLNASNKFQVESTGSKFDAVKLTHTRGVSQLKLKMIIPGRQPVIGLDTYHGSQKWDLEYNAKTGAFTGKVKVWPMTLAVNTKANFDGISPLSYAITAERMWYI